MAPSSGRRGKSQRHESRAGSNAIGGNLHSNEPWKDVPRATMDEVSSHVCLDLPFLRPPRYQLQKKPFRRLSSIANAMTVKRVITTKAIAAPSSCCCFLSRWIRIEQHSSLRKL